MNGKIYPPEEGGTATATYIEEEGSQGHMYDSMYLLSTYLPAVGPEVPCADSFDLVAHIFRDVPVKFQELSLSSSSFAYPFAFQNEGLPCSVPQTSNPRAVAAETTRG